MGLGVTKHTFTRLGQLILVGQKKQEQIMLIILFCTIVLLNGELSLVCIGIDTPTIVRWCVNDRLVSYYTFLCNYV